MTVTLKLPLEVEQAYITEALARGLPVEEVVSEVLMAARPSGPPAQLSPEEWVREFQARMRSHAEMDLPLLSDEDISRESIYADRGP